MLRLRRLPTTQAVFSQLTVLLFDYCILVLCIYQTERQTEAIPMLYSVSPFWTARFYRPLTSGRARVVSF